MLALAACGGSGAGTATVSNGDGPPSFSTKTVAGAPFRSASFTGKPTVLWFWAPWCTVCRAEAPDVAKAAAAMKAEVTFVGVAGRGEVPAMKQFIRQTDTGGFTHVVDGDGSIWSAYGVAAQPAFAFIDAEGNVSMKMGSLGYDALVERVQRLAKT